ncbi:MAG: lipoate-protein ligase A [Pirellulaceae bacterium]|jgi:lipoate-protein ligase A
MAVDESLLISLGSSSDPRNQNTADNVVKDAAEDNVAAIDGSSNIDSGKGLSGWTLRLYTWVEPTLSLGYFQNYRSRELHEASRGCPVVRRASGGGAIMHDRELTYSFVAPVTNRFAANVELIYDLFHQTLIASLKELTGAEGELCVPGAKVASTDEPFLCFQRRAKGDVLIDGYKVCGSAQRRRKNVVLQHGSVLLDQSPNAPELPGIVQLTGKTVTSDQLANQWLKQLSHQWELPLENGDLTADQRQQALEIEGVKFSSPSWTQRR